MIRVPIAGSLRATVETAMRTTRRPINAIAAETGVLPATIRSWNRRHGWRPPAATAATGFDPARWNTARRAAVARLYAQPWLDIGDLALAMRVPRRRAEALFTRCGLEGRRSGAVAVASGPDTDPRHLRAALRLQIARQIVRLDAALSADDGAADPKAFDSARVLRDLGGLKRLLDEADQDERGKPERPTKAGRNTGAGDGAEFDGDATAARDHDLPALRAEIARRLEAFGTERPDAGIPGEPAPAPDPGARR